MKIDTLMKALKDVSDESVEDEIPESEEDSYKNEEVIVHTAIGILRRRMKKPKEQWEKCYSSEELTLESLKKFVDPLLLKAIRWLTDEQLFISADKLPDEYNLQCLNIACDLTTLATPILSPKHLGLAVHLHHEYGSRKLIEHMYPLGYYISYTELRHFLTFSAMFISSTQTSQDGAFVPPHLQPKVQGGKLKVGVADNWDHNKRTVDGKHTTHAMSSILVTPSNLTSLPLPPIHRVQGRVLDITKLPGIVCTHS